MSFASSLVAQSTSCASFQKLNLTKAGERKQHVSTSKRRFKRRGRWVCTTRASASNDFVEQQQQQQQQEQLKVNTSSKAHKKKYISSVATRSTTSASAVEMLVHTEQDNATKSNFINTKDKKMLRKATSTTTSTPTPTKQKWWENYQSTASQPRNLISVKNIDEFLSYLYASATMIHRDIDNQSNSIDEDVEEEEKSNSVQRILERKSPLVVVKYFREDCPACRSIHPKFAKIAEREFSNVLFLKVNLSEFDDSFAEEMNMVSVPHVQVYNGAEGLVSESSLNLMPKSLRNFRNILDAYTSCVDNLPKREIQGPASILSAAGWPGIYSGQMKYLAECKRNFWRFRRAEEDGKEDGDV